MNRPSSIPATIFVILASKETVSSSELAAVAGVTRQAAHYHLRRLSDEGVLAPEGSRRSSRYRLRADRVASYPLHGQMEHEVWAAEKKALGVLDPDLLSGPILGVLNFTFTEMVNNAIDHSLGTSLSIRWILAASTVTFEVEDNGVGAFEALRESRGFTSNFQSIGELSKGKQTSAPDRHSGLGIFLTSKLTSLFTLIANEYSWKVDAEADDYAIGALPHYKQGTLVRCVVPRDVTVTLQDVMRQVSDPVTHRLNRTSLKVELFSEGMFISRTEAKLLSARLEGFEKVELDFTNVDEIGQGFADELFRVWKRDHEEIELIPINLNHAVRAMIAAVEAE